MLCIEREMPVPPIEGTGFVTCGLTVVPSVFATAAIFIHDAFDVRPCLAGTFLDATDQFIFLAFDKLQIIVRQFRKFLFQLALGNVPVSFDFEGAHKFYPLLCSRVLSRIVRRFLQKVCHENPAAFPVKNTNDFDPILKKRRLHAVFFPARVLQIAIKSFPQFASCTIGTG
jgi:hypothetical protein